MGFEERWRGGVEDGADRWPTFELSPTDYEPAVAPPDVVEDLLTGHAAADTRDAVVGVVQGRGHEASRLPKVTTRMRRRPIAVYSS